jgi:hypothetical protein
MRKIESVTVLVFAVGVPVVSFLFLFVLVL